MRNPLAERYAKALISAAESASVKEQVEQDILMLGQLFQESVELPELLDRAAKFPEITHSLCRYLDEKSVLAPLTVKFLNLLSLRQRMALLPAITGAYLDEMNKKRNNILASVSSVRALDDDERVQIQNRLNSLTGSTVQIEWKQDPSILGGVFIQIGDTILDGTLKSRINQLKQHLIQ